MESSAQTRARAWSAVIDLLTDDRESPAIVHLAA
jgi:hypothetical protein